MNKELKHIIIKELLWLLGIMAVSAIIEVIIIMLLDLHPVLSVKIQGFIGLMVIGLTIRVAARIRAAYRTHPDPTKNGQKSLE